MAVNRTDAVGVIPFEHAENGVAETFARLPVERPLGFRRIQHHGRNIVAAARHGRRFFRLQGKIFRHGIENFPYLVAEPKISGNMGTPR